MENPPRAKFCVECARPVSYAGVAPGRSAPRRGSSARHLGAKILASLSAFGCPRSELLALAVVMLVAAFLRTYRLTELPSGLHGDEAITGLEGLRILREGPIGPYSPLALGQPAGPLYLTALAVALFGNTILAVRIVPAFLGIATVPALYLVARRSFGSPVGLLSAALLATMGWHIHFAHIGFPVEAWPLMGILVAGALAEALREGQERWWMIAGAVGGLGLYAYNAHPLLLAILAACIGGFALLRGIRARGRRIRQDLIAAALFGATAALAATPLALYALDERHGYFEHFNQASVLRRPEWTTLTGPERAHFVVARYAAYWDRVCCHPRPDGVDASGITPIVPPQLLLLALFGAVVGVTDTRRDPLVVVSVAIVGLLPLAAVFTSEEAVRRTFALAPFLALLAGIGLRSLALFLRRLPRRGIARGVQVAAVATALLLMIYPQLNDYFGRFANDPQQRWVFAEELAHASRYMATLPAGSHVYFYADRWSVNYDTRRFLAPQVSAEDRSKQFGRFSLDVDLGRGTPVFLFLGSYRGTEDEAQRRYPGGRLVRASVDGRPTFVAYHLDPEPAP
jgi:4-amino-4-deoxy-L-arabinose transferase-like glycosyltransferase